jgi:AcrR family transcriptional regulator
MTTVSGAVQADQDRKTPGRPRSARADEAIIESVLDLMAEGTAFDALSIEAIAARAGVGKATIYRRWANKEALIVDAVATVKGEPGKVAGVSVRDDLIALLRPVGRAPSTRTGRIMPCLLVELQRSPDLRRIYDQITAPRREMMREVLRRGIREGTLRPDFDMDAVIAMLIGPLVARALVPHGNPAAPRPETPERLVDAIWPAIAA